VSDRDQRTEQPTQQRVKKARSEGRFPASREFVSAVQFAVFAMMINATSHLWWPGLQNLMSRLLSQAFTLEVSIRSLQFLLRDQLTLPACAVLAAGAAISASGVFAQLVTSGFGISLARLSPDLTRLNPLTQLKEVPSRNLRSFIEAVLLLPALLLACYTIVRAQWSTFLALPLRARGQALAVIGDALSDVLIKATLVFLIWGAVDLVRQRRRYTRDLRMTKQEIREEHKSNEGNPEVRMKIRRMRRELLRRRMMSEVPTATAIVVNPTHYSVALKYDLDHMVAPRVVAKGKNYLALRIRAVALENQVPIIENPPLARALYKHVDVGQEIPAHLYRAVAEVLAYVFRLMHGPRPGNGPHGKGPTL